MLLIVHVRTNTPCIRRTAPSCRPRKISVVVHPTLHADALPLQVLLDRLWQLTRYPDGIHAWLVRVDSLVLRLERRHVSVKQKRSSDSRETYHPRKLRLNHRTRPIKRPRRALQHPVRAPLHLQQVLAVRTALLLECLRRLDDRAEHAGSELGFGRHGRGPAVRSQGVQKTWDVGAPWTLTGPLPRSRAGTKAVKS